MIARLVFTTAILSFVVLATPAARADESSRTNADSNVDQTLLGTKTRHGAYGAPETKITTMTGDAAVVMGAQGGWIINRRVVIGGAGYGLVSRHTPDIQLQRSTGASRLELGYGGLRVAYIVEPMRFVHVTGGVLVGAGALTIATRDAAQQDGLFHHDGAGFFALEPQLEVDLSVGRYVRLALGSSFRFLSSTGKPGLAANDLSGLAGSVSVKIGVF